MEGRDSIVLTFRDVDEMIRDDIKKRNELQNALNRANREAEIIQSLTNIYYIIYVVDLRTYQFKEIKSPPEVEEFVNQYTDARDCLEKLPEVMIEAEMKGTEISCGHYKTKKHEVALPITEVVPANEFFDYNAKYNGEVQEITPARIPDEITDRVHQINSAIYQILGANGIIRVDYIISDEGKIQMLEINTTPGMTATSFIPQQVKAAGLDMKDVLTEIIENQFD